MTILSPLKSASLVYINRAFIWLFRASLRLDRYRPLHYSLQVSSSRPFEATQDQQSLSFPVPKLFFCFLLPLQSCQHEAKFNVLVAWARYGYWSFRDVPIPQIQIKNALVRTCLLSLNTYIWLVSMGWENLNRRLKGTGANLVFCHVLNSIFYMKEFLLIFSE